MTADQPAEAGRGVLIDCRSVGYLGFALPAGPTIRVFVPAGTAVLPFTIASLVSTETAADATVWVLN